MTRAVYLGSKALGLRVLNCLAESRTDVLWTIIHPNDVHDDRSDLGAFRDFAASRDIELQVVQSQAEARSIIAGLNPSIGFVCGWYWLFSPSDIDFFPKGLWGIHNSLLPKFRGGAPLVWSIIAGAREVGSTVFRLGSGIDDGDVLMQVPVQLGDSDDVGQALTRIEAGLLSQLGAKWRDLLAGHAVLAHQNEAFATYCGQRSDEDGMIEWSYPAEKLHDFVRAQAPPYPCAWTLMGQERLRIVKSKPFCGIYHGTPGQVLRRTGGTVLVSCGSQTALELLAIRREPDSEVRVPSTIIRSVKDRLSSTPRLP